MKNIAVFFGGKSVEHDISVITALQAMKNLGSYKVYPVYIKPDGSFVTGDNLNLPSTYQNFARKAKGEKIVTFEMGSGKMLILNHGKIKDKVKIDCAVLCNHGHGGEDGSLQGMLELAEIPYTSSGVASSAICMDKVLTKVMLKNASLLTPAYVQFDKSSYEANKEKILKQISKQLGSETIVKPANLGSSVGISICEDEAKLDFAIAEALHFDDKIIVEKFVDNAREFCCACVKIDDKIFPSRVQEVSKDKIYTFSDKYLTKSEGEKREISKSLYARIEKLAIEAFKVLDCQGVVRVDFLFDEKGSKLYVNEVNSIPGSLAFNLFDTSFVDLLNTLITDAIERFEKKNEIVYKFSSEAIDKYIEMSGFSKSKLK